MRQNLKKKTQYIIIIGCHISEWINIIFIFITLYSKFEEQLNRKNFWVRSSETDITTHGPCDIHIGFVYQNITHSDSPILFCFIFFIFVMNKFEKRCHALQNDPNRLIRTLFTHTHATHTNTQIEIQANTRKQSIQRVLVWTRSTTIKCDDAMLTLSVGVATVSFSTLIRFINRNDIISLSVSFLHSFFRVKNTCACLLCSRRQWWRWRRQWRWWRCVLHRHTHVISFWRYRTCLF